MSAGAIAMFGAGDHTIKLEKPGFKFRGKTLTLTERRKRDGERLNLKNNLALCSNRRYIASR